MNNALIGAVRKGYEARQGKTGRMSDCPYKDKRGDNGRITFSRAFRKAWLAGYDLCHHNELHGDYDGWYADRIDQL